MVQDVVICFRVHVSAVHAHPEGVLCAGVGVTELLLAHRQSSGCLPYQVFYTAYLTHSYFLAWYVQPVRGRASSPIFLCIFFLFAQQVLQARCHSSALIASGLDAFKQVSLILQQLQLLVVSVSCCECRRQHRS